MKQLDSLLLVARQVSRDPQASADLRGSLVVGALRVLVADRETKAFRGLPIHQGIGLNHENLLALTKAS